MRLHERLIKEKVVTKKEALLVPRSFDVVGDIAIFNEFPSALQKKEKKIARCLLQEKQINVVAKKSKHYAGRLRTPTITVLAGERRKTTIHNESGCRLAVDVEKCYFSTRSGTERLRLAKLIKNNENVLVMFSGIGALPCVLSKQSKAKAIGGIELNSTAHKYAEKNMQLNKCTNVTLYKGNVTKVVPTLRNKFDHIIMPLPKTAENYLSLAIKKLKPKGTIHLYTFAEEKEFSTLKKHYKEQFKTVKIIKAGTYSPGVYRVCVMLR